MPLQKNRLPILTFLDSFLWSTVTKTTKNVVLSTEKKNWPPLEHMQLSKSTSRLKDATNHRTPHEMMNTSQMSLQKWARTRNESRLHCKVGKRRMTWNFEFISMLTWQDCIGYGQTQPAHCTDDIAKIILLSSSRRTTLAWEYRHHDQNKLLPSRAHRL